MKLRTLVIMGLGLAGVVFSYYEFLGWFSANGFNIVEGWKQGFAVTGFARGFLLDLVACTALVLALAIWDYKKLGPFWAMAVVVGTIVFGVSLGFACYVIGRAQAGWTEA